MALVSVAMHHCGRNKKELVNVVMNDMWCLKNGTGQCCDASHGGHQHSTGQCCDASNMGPQNGTGQCCDASHFGQNMPQRGTTIALVSVVMPHMWGRKMALVSVAMPHFGSIKMALVSVVMHHIWCLKNGTGQCCAASNGGH